jgi:hypothetical protein
MTTGGRTPLPDLVAEPTLQHVNIIDSCIGGSTPGRRRLLLEQGTTLAAKPGRPEDRLPGHTQVPGRLEIGINQRRIINGRVSR